MSESIDGACCPGPDRSPQPERTAKQPTRSARMLVLPIIAYRRWISPALPARCRFYPTCSAYALEAVTRHGGLKGTGLTARRLLKCQPFHPGGYDPVPEPGRRRRRTDATGARIV